MTPINRESRLNIWQWVIWLKENDQRKSVGRINSYGCVINKVYCYQGVVNEKDFEVIIRILLAKKGTKR
jgi:hypothetical protein